MKTLIFLFCLGPAFSMAVGKGYCLDSDNGTTPKKRGKVTIRLPNTNILNSDWDFCKDSKTLVEFYCDDKGEQQRKEISCPCNKGACP